jgi:hypothetical protein
MSYSVNPLNFKSLKIGTPASVAYAVNAFSTVGNINMVSTGLNITGATTEYAMYGNSTPGPALSLVLA